MAEIKSILVNGKQYKVQMLPVLDTIDLHLDALESFGEAIGKYILTIADIKAGRAVNNDEICSVLRLISSEKSKPLKTKILGQVITPENKFLSDPVAIEAWFSKPENKEDVWEVLIQATKELLGEYLPNFLRDLANQAPGKVEADKSKSQKSTDAKPSSTDQ